MVGGGRRGLTADCEEEWQPVVSLIFMRFYHVEGGCGGEFCCTLLKLKITVHPVMQKARVIEAKTQYSFVDSHNSSMRKSVWWVWPQPLARYIDRKCYKFWPYFGLLGWRGLSAHSINITI